MYPRLNAAQHCAALKQNAPSVAALQATFSGKMPLYLVTSLSYGCYFGPPGRLSCSEHLA